MYGESRCQSLLGIKGLKELKATHYLRPLLYILFSFCKEMHNSVCLAPILHYMYMQATLLVMRNLLLFLHVSLQSKYLEYQVYLPTTNRKQINNTVSTNATEDSPLNNKSQNKLLDKCKTLKVYTLMLFLTEDCSSSLNPFNFLSQRCLYK